MSTADSPLKAQVKLPDFADKARSYAIARWRPRPDDVESAGEGVLRCRRGVTGSGQVSVNRPSIGQRIERPSVLQLRALLCHPGWGARTGFSDNGRWLGNPRPFEQECRNAGELVGGVSRELRQSRGGSGQRAATSPGLPVACGDR